MIIKLKPFFVTAIVLLITISNNRIQAQTSEYEMLVSSRNTHSVKRFNGHTGDFIDDFVSAGSGGLSTTQDLIAMPDGNILVSGRGNTSVLMYERASGDFLQPFTSGYTLDNPTKIALGPDGNLYVSQWGSSQSTVARFNGISGQFIDDFTPDLNLPLGHLWDSEGNLYVACYGSKDVRKFDSTGDFLGIFTEAGHLQGPTNLWFDENGSLFVIDWPLGSVLEFNESTGAFVKTFISGLQNAEGYDFGPDGNLYICDWSQNHINRYSPDGTFIDVFASQGNMQAPNSILFRPVQVTSVDNKTGSIPDNFYLEQNFPNPFNPGTTIKFGIDRGGEVKLKVFNMIGEEIRSLVDQNLDPGSYRVEFDAEDLNSGVYLYALITNKKKIIRKMTLLK
jgi:streptogramin lyase